VKLSLLTPLEFVSALKILTLHPDPDILIFLFAFVQSNKKNKLSRLINMKQVKYLYLKDFENATFQRIHKNVNIDFVSTDKNKNPLFDVIANIYFLPKNDKFFGKGKILFGRVPFKGPFLLAHFTLPRIQV